ncbi:hypothetical protein H4684_002787 [Desulfomicrobium macestii]|uniref:Apea-like HEPN domain-containing protein n=1 Tax=Desulfomicrobium macestii TaxID=90731 RepID=A0ABR9H5Y7_9BACT|nr:hypothetical protein [Desulfomicrobium macestii]MBE1426126.1 hypothetical protein [Desulfomicrobium macestii]
MTNDQELRQTFFNHICSYPQFREDKYFTLEFFCVYLSYCFGFDGNIDISPKPNDVYDLLIDAIIEEFGIEKTSKLVKRQKISNWRSELESFFPEKTQTLIHISALVIVADRWIYRIGHELMNLPEPNNPTKYFSWVQDDWIATYTLINNFHNQLWSLCKEIDKESHGKNRYSIFETIYLSIKTDKTFEESKEYIIKRNELIDKTTEKVKKSINDKYYIEAITLSENIIKNVIYNHLTNTNQNPFGLNFSKLIEKSILIEKNNIDINLFKKIDKWRKFRNKCVHENINSCYDGELTDTHLHEEELQKTANYGLQLCEESISWYKSKCVKYLVHEFPQDSPNNIQ